jgi:hypothetical protein
MSDKSILKELMVAQHNPIGMFTRETVQLYWENYQLQQLRTDLINLWLNS